MDEPIDDERAIVRTFFLGMVFVAFAVPLFVYKSLRGEELIGSANDPFSHGLSVAVPVLILAGGVAGWRKGDGRRNQAIEGVVMMAKVCIWLSPVMFGWLVLTALMNL